jgi:hypothetical protein
MESTKIKNVKGAVHLACAIAPLLEIKHSSSKFRNVLIGLCAGWHLSCAWYHFAIEKEEPKEKKRVRKPIIQSTRVN